VSALTAKRSLDAAGAGAFATIGRSESDGGAMPIFFCVTERGQLACLGEQAGEAQAEQAAIRLGQELRFLLSQSTAVLLLRRLHLFGGLEPLPGLVWFTHFEWDGKLYLLEELGSRDEAAAILASCDDEPVALLGSAEMQEWAATLERGLRTPA
jgi:hypothetical protein